MSDPKTEITHTLSVSEQRQELCKNGLDYVLYSKWHRRLCYFPLNLTVIFFWLAVGGYSVWYSSEPLSFKMAITIGMGGFGYGITLLLRASYGSRMRHYMKSVISKTENPMTITFSEGTLSLTQGETQEIFRKVNGLLLKPYRSIMIITTNDQEFFLPRRLFTPEVMRLVS
ncbi:MAG: hypothetical protein LAT79_06495 [Kiritimatiellae bacterium]|nr:hypothetical protein [Kiritimatiellia bacterium]